MTARVLSRSSTARLIGVDVARCAALIGMAATHIFPGFNADGTLHASHAIASGRASALFAVLAGVGLALGSGGVSPPRGRRLAAARVGVFVRALLLVATGLLLGEVESPPLVILAYYGLLFAVMTPFLGLRARTLAVLAVLAALVTPFASFVLRQYVDPAPIQEPGGADLPVELFLTGTYPVLTWTTYALAGLAVGRTDLRRLSAVGRLLAVGAVLAVGARMLSGELLDAVGGPDRLRGWSGDTDDALAAGMFGTTPREDWRWLIVSAPHSGTSLDLAHTVGTALLVLGVALLLARLLPRVLLLPFAALGSMTLTLYTLHVLAVADDSPFLMSVPADLWLTQVVVGLLVATFWRTTIGRGPLEAAAAWADRSARSAVTGESRAAARL